MRFPRGITRGEKREGRSPGTGGICTARGSKDTVNSGRVFSDMGSGLHPLTFFVVEGYTAYAEKNVERICMSFNRKSGCCLHSHLGEMSEREIDATILLEFYCNVTRGRG